MMEQKRMSIGIKQLAVAIILFMLIGIYSASWLGIWSTESSKVPAKYEAGSEAEGQYRADDIRGSYTFGEVADLYGIDREVLRQAFGLPDDLDLNVYQLKNLEALYADSPVEIGTGSIRVFVALYNDLPYELEGDALPLAAAEILLQHDNGLDEEERAYLEKIVEGREGTDSSQAPVITEQIQSNAPAVAETPVAETPVAESVAQPVSEGNGTGNGTQVHVEGEEPAINGQSTFAAVLALGVTQEQIEGVIGGDMPAKNLSIRDYCRDKGLQFSIVKNQLLALVEE